MSAHYALDEINLAIRAMRDGATAGRVMIRFDMPTQSLRLEDAAAWHGCVLAYGHFNTIHPGHIRYLRHARGLGDQLVVALLETALVCLQQQERVEALFTGIADAVLLLEADELKEAIDALQPKVLVLGNEFKNKAEIQTTLVQQRQQGGTVQFHAGDIHYATDLLSGSERDLRQQRRSSFQEPAAGRALNKVNYWRPSTAGNPPFDCAGRQYR